MVPEKVDWFVTQALTPGTVWARHASALGLDKFRETYGEHWPPEAARPGETVWTFRDPDRPRPVFDPKDHPAGWLSLTVDQFNPAYVHMSRGVWPEWHGHGLGLDMRAWAERWCRKRGAQALYIEVLAVNKQHVRNVLCDIYWRQRGMIVWPVLSHLFVHEIGD